MLREEKLKNCLQGVMGPVTETLTPSASLIDDLGMSSLDLVEFVMAIEDEFQIEIDDDDADKLRTWGNCLTLIDKMVKRRDKAAGQAAGTSAGS